MICINICSNREWRSMKAILKVNENQLEQYPYGEFITLNFANRNCIFYHSGISKTRSSAATQFAIDHWKPEIIFVTGTCGGVSEELNIMDIIVINKTAQYDCIANVKGERPLFYEPFITNIDNSWIDFEAINAFEGMIATADRSLTQESMKILRNEHVACADWESGAISVVCRANDVKVCIIRGITDAPKLGNPDSELIQEND